MANQPTVLVTGATGRVGGQLARQLQGSRLAVRALIVALVRAGAHFERGVLVERPEAAAA